MQNFIIPKSWTFVISLGTISVRSVKIPNQEFLNDKKIIGIETYTTDQMAKSVSGTTIVSPTGAKNISLVLQSAAVNKIYQIPYLAFNTAVNYGFIKAIEPTVFDWSASTLNITGTTGLTNNEGVLITVFYL